MAKNMARIKDGIVVNIEWCADHEPETESLISMKDLPIMVGDSYDNGKFYRDGSEVLTPLGEASAKILELNDQLAENVEALQILGVKV